MNAAVDRQLSVLPELSSTELRDLWRRLVGEVVPRVSPSLLRLALAWEIQARAYGGVPRTTRARLDQLARGATRTTTPAAGMRLVREYGGKVHVVIVGEDRAIHWDDRQWKSLSEVARAITGTRWSGPAFFGLKRKVAA
ncbi:DUF2924 domain-containing protein [Sphingomonas nostoxanthinifaciens]|uniref:DUF2924 domain-containing protein n=1 Tax=Sphingomonas nostoxanthinifaciens TaxID=2872652 RepID=UPI001CC205D5|nr:DUF2924 domain-containing protein [Sphingomonas nostoxanthinifaciens]UAK25603.1 DUF2924 domain-containing protein [Sphingomonas nostoxanthinifaciens]